MHDHDGSRPPRAPRGGDPWDGDGWLRLAAVIARAQFGSAARKYGIAYDDFAQEGVVRMYRYCAAKHLDPNPGILHVCVKRAGIDLIRRTPGPSGFREPRGEAGGRLQPAVVLTPLDEPEHSVRAALEDDVDDRAIEAVMWEDAAHRLGRDVDARPVTGRVRRTVGEMCGPVALELARALAVDPDLRDAYAQDPKPTVWPVIRRLDWLRFGGYDIDAFPPKDRPGDRRRAFRIAECVVGRLTRLISSPGDGRSQ